MKKRGPSFFSFLERAALNTCIAMLGCGGRCKILYSVDHDSPPPLSTGMKMVTWWSIGVVTPSSSPL